MAHIVDVLNHFGTINLLHLLEKAGRERRTSGAVDAVRKAAREARVPGEPIGIVRGDELVEGLISDPPAQYIPCVEAAVAAAEAGPDGAAERLEAWRSLRVPDVLAAALDVAYDRCWPSGDPEIAPMVREQWREATQEALTQPGVTMGVASLRILAEPGGCWTSWRPRGWTCAGRTGGRTSRRTAKHRPNRPNRSDRPHWLVVNGDVKDPSLTP